MAAAAWVLLLLATGAAAHPGGVDASGCHRDKAKGEFHCHPERAAGAKAARPLERFSGRVVGVSDGDTLTVLLDGKGVKIRLYGVDCPEKKQAFGARAKQFTSSRAYGKTVTVRVHDTDRYGRLVAEVVLEDGSLLNHELVREGLAWWYRHYAPADPDLARLEAEARKSKRGLWAEEGAQEPWNFRAAARGKTGV